MESTDHTDPTYPTKSKECTEPILYGLYIPSLDTSTGMMVYIPIMCITAINRDAAIIIVNTIIDEIMNMQLDMRISDLLSFPFRSISQSVKTRLDSFKLLEIPTDTKITVASISFERRTDRKCPSGSGSSITIAFILDKSDSASASEKCQININNNQFMLNPVHPELSNGISCDVIELLSPYNVFYRCNTTKDIFNDASKWHYFDLLVFTTFEEWNREFTEVIRCAQFPNSN